MQDTRIELIKVSNRYRKDMGDLDSLAASIEAIGLLQPIGIDSNYRLIFGERRLRAFEKLGRERIPARIINVPSLLSEHAENEIRKDFTPSERVAIGKAMEESLGNRRGQRTDLKPDGQGELLEPELSENFCEVKGKRSDQIAAKQAGFGNETTYRQAKTVVEKAAPELVEAMDRGDVAISTAATLTELPPDIQAEVVAQGPEQMKETAKEIKRAHVANNSGDNEWYTPKEYIDAAKDVLGVFDLDPASNPAANDVVGAVQFFTAEDDGLKHSWAGKVWMNPPYASSLIGQFAEKLASHAETGDVTEAVVLVNNATETAWFSRLSQVATALCFPRGRVKFWAPGKPLAAPLQGQALLYIGGNPSGFIERFASFGVVAEVRK